MMVHIGRNHPHRPAPSTTKIMIICKIITIKINNDTNSNKSFVFTRQRYAWQYHKYYHHYWRRILPLLLKTMPYINANKLSNLNRILSLINCPCRHWMFSNKIFRRESMPAKVRIVQNPSYFGKTTKFKIVYYMFITLICIIK